MTRISCRRRRAAAVAAARPGGDTRRAAVGLTDACDHEMQTDDPADSRADAPPARRTWSRGSSGSGFGGGACGGDEVQTHFMSGPWLGPEAGKRYVLCTRTIARFAAFGPVKPLFNGCGRSTQSAIRRFSDPAARRV